MYYSLNLLLKVKRCILSESQVQLLEGGCRPEKIHLKAERSNSISDVWKWNSSDDRLYFSVSSNMFVRLLWKRSSQVGEDHIHVMGILWTDGPEGILERSWRYLYIFAHQFVTLKCGYRTEKYRNGNQLGKNQMV